MSLYKYFTPDGSLPLKYDPAVKLDLLNRYVTPLLSAFNINDKQMAIFIIRMVQGDAW